MIKFRVLGEIQLGQSDGTTFDALLRQPKRLAVLAYLASPAPGTWHRRDMLLAMFWPELDTPHARTSLRNAIYVLRQILGDDVIVNRGDEEVSIDPALLETDLAYVWDALKRGNADEALTHYGGELLPGLYPSDSEGFLRWLDSERARLRVAVSTTAMARIDELERNGHPLKALSIARTVSEINADDETIVRRLMTLHETVGDRAGGLATFDAFRSRLASDYDAEPAPETVEIANRLRSSSGAPPPRRRTPVVEGAPPVREEIYLSPTRSRRRTTIVVAAAGLIAVAATGAWKLSRTEAVGTIGRSSPVTADEGLQVEAAISPNGRLVAYAKGSSSSLKIFVQKIGGEAPLPLTTDSVNVELMPRWSPDNDQILYLSQNNAYVAPPIGGTPRRVARGSEGDGAIRSAAWSPAGDSLAIVRHDSLFVQPLRGAGLRLVGRGPQLHSCQWSPDGKWIACVSGNWIAFTPGPLFGNEAPSSIVLYPAAGGNAIVLTEKDYESESPAWSADGKYLAMLSNRDGVPGEAYAVRIGSDGKAAGKFIKLGVRAEFIGLASGRIAYSVPSKKANLWSIPIPADTVVSMASATAITSGNQVIEVVSLSRDGKWIAYDSNLSGNSDIYRIPVGGGTSEVITDDPRQEFAPEISPDGREIAWHRWVNGYRRLFVKNLDSADAHEILPIPGDQGVPRWSGDGTSIAGWAHNHERGAVFVLNRVASSKWKRAWQLDYGQGPIWSPNERQILFVTRDGKIQSVPRDSGEVQTVYQPAGSDPLATFLVWSTDPDVIYMLGQQGRDQGIWSLRLSDGRRRLLVRLHDPVSKSVGPGFTSDGKNFYFPLVERSSNVRWAEFAR